MTIKPFYTALGFVTLIRFVDSKGEEWEFTFPKKQSWGVSGSKNARVMLAKNQKEIIVIGWKPKITKMPRDGKLQKKLAHMWSHWHVQNAWELSIPNVKLNKVGKITRIEYISDKFERSGDKRGKFNLYRHDFKKKVDFYSNKSETVFQFKHPQLLSSRGILP